MRWFFPLIVYGLKGLSFSSVLRCLSFTLWSQSDQSLWDRQQQQQQQEMGNVLRSLYGHCCKPTTTDDYSQSLGPHGVSAANVGVSALAQDLFQFQITSQVYIYVGGSFSLTFSFHFHGKWFTLLLYIIAMLNLVFLLRLKDRYWNVKSSTCLQVEGFCKEKWLFV